MGAALREKTLWKTLYEAAARADEVLSLNVEDPYPQDKCGKITAEGGAAELDGWTLHQLRPPSAFTHDAGGGTSTSMLVARPGTPPYRP
ncbi:hypothetical protein ACFWOX_24140 [Streptomyces sp. NPDC058467]|uniref:hypothetical protein n=1 Tax=Streptomyces sp. NPDC058467 TaxID=3346513 RepID=UPI0036659F9C